MTNAYPRVSNRVLRKVNKVAAKARPTGVVPKFRKPPVLFTDDRKQKFLDHYRLTGLYYMSAGVAGVSGQTVRHHIQNDKEFGAAAEQAMQDWLDEAELKIMSRAIDGVEEPVIGGKNRDEIVAHVKRYSDGLASQLLRAKRPEYREKQQIDMNVKGGVLVVPQKPATAEEWEAQHGEAAAGKTPSSDD